MADIKVVLNQFGSVENIQVEAFGQLPEPGPKDVLIKIEASTVSATDIFIRKGIYPLLKEKPPFTPGYDFVGRIVAIGSKVNRWKIGDRVADVCMTGGNADYVVGHEDSLLRVMEDLPAEQAVCLVMSGMTAYQIFRLFNLKKGQSMLVHGGTGAIGSLLLALGQQNGIKTVATGATAKLDFIRAFKATAVGYDRPDYFEKLAESAGNGFDAVFDFTNQRSFNQSFRMLKKGGKLITSAVYTSGMKIDKKSVLSFIGFSLDFGLMMLKLKWWNLLPNGKYASFYGVLDRKRADHQKYQNDFDELQQLVLDKKIHLPIHQVYSLDKVKEAHADVERGKRTGFLVVKNQFI